MATIKLRRGTAAQWASVNPTLAAGEPGIETDTGVLKIGDGSANWDALDPVLDGTYAPLSSPVGSYTYDGNGNVETTPDGTTYTWESDGSGGYRVATETVNGVTRTFTYNGDGTLGSVA